MKNWVINAQVRFVLIDGTSQQDAQRLYRERIEALRKEGWFIEEQGLRKESYDSGDYS